MLPLRLRSGLKALFTRNNSSCDKLRQSDGLCLARNDEKQPKLNMLAREPLPIGLARLAVQQRVLWHVCSFCVPRYQAAYFPRALLLRCHHSPFQNRDQKRETAASCESFNPMLPQQPTACRGMDSISRRFRPFPHLKAQLRLSAGNVLAFFLPVSRETFSAKKHLLPQQNCRTSRGLSEI